MMTTVLPSLSVHGNTTCLPVASRCMLSHVIASGLKLFRLIHAHILYIPNVKYEVHRENEFTWKILPIKCGMKHS